MTMPTPRDPDKLHNRLHQVMRQQDTSPFSVSNNSNTHATNELKSLLTYYFEDRPNDDGERSDTEILYNQNEQPLFKSIILRESSTFQKNKQFNPYSEAYVKNSNPRFGCTKQPKQSSQVPRKNSSDSNGKQMLCHICGSWFHLQSERP